MYESQHWRVRKCHISGKFVGYMIKQRQGSADSYDTISLSSVAKEPTDELPKSMAQKKMEFFMLDVEAIRTD